MNNQPEPPDGQRSILSAADVLTNLAAADPRNRRRRVVVSVTEFQQGLDRLAERGIVQRVRHSDGSTMYGCAARRRTRTGRSSRIATNARAKGSKRSTAGKSARQSSSDDPGESGDSDDDGGDGERPKVCRSPRCDNRHARRSPYCSGRCKKWHQRHPHGVLEPVKADAPLDRNLSDLSLDQLYARIEDLRALRAWGWRQYPPIPAGAAVHATSEPTGLEAELRDLWRYVRLQRAGSDGDEISDGKRLASAPLAAKGPVDISIGGGTKAARHGHWPERRPRSARSSSQGQTAAGATPEKLPPRAVKFCPDQPRPETAYAHLQRIEEERRRERLSVVEAPLSGISDTSANADTPRAVAA